MHCQNITGNIECYHIFLFFQVNDDSIENRLLDPSGEITEVEWEEDWNKELETLTQCYEQSSPYSACPSMARGDIIDAMDVRKILE